MHGFREILCQLPDLLVDVEDRLSSLAKAGIREANNRTDRHAIALRTQQVKIDVEFLIATAVPKHLDFIAIQALPSKPAGGETAAGIPAEKNSGALPIQAKSLPRFVPRKASSGGRNPDCPAQTSVGQGCYAPAAFHHTRHRRTSKVSQSLERGTIKEI
jgi:hypothetical protein